MLLAVEGGGFFSSSASGYSKGLTLLLLGQKNEEKPMRVTPWNQYQLVDQESNPDLQLASNKNRLVRGCTSFLCFGRASAGHESPYPLKVGPTHHQDVRKSSPDPEKVKENVRSSDLVEGDNISRTSASSLRSSLKRPATNVQVSVAVNHEGEDEPVNQNGSSGRGHAERRVQWTDVSGGELFMIREFEPSEHSGSDDEFETGNERKCSCRIM